MSTSHAITPDSVTVADALPGLLVKAGGFALGAAGFFTAGSGLQLLAFLEPSWVVVLSSAMLMTLGSVACLVAPNVILGRSWAAIFGVPVVLTMALFVVVWGAWSSVMLFLSPLTLLAMATSVGAALLVPFTVPGSLRATRARNALYA